MHGLSFASMFGFILLYPIGTELGPQTQVCMAIALAFAFALVLPLAAAARERVCPGLNNHDSPQHWSKRSLPKPQQSQGRQMKSLLKEFHVILAAGVFGGTRQPCSMH